MPAAKTTPDSPEVPAGHTKATVTRLGAGHISTGVRVNDKDVTHEQGDEVVFFDAIIENLEKRAWVAVI